ncbi:MmcQ/YjbR family DNA-binding protein [Sphingomonas sp. MG17]|jgi:predicted DNA-binding protein (MmcQ/YjbR family)|uniref:MmcQ/YjbR family DNA-binding protein n=1 Tax=Sphingomonas tagetis TaxID=2949092 RepID=A0A9X2HGK6_9SPHN|nr:MmcQ/YjbR family DNA-binding protein [Sphingomonas tagetis]MCP3730741.1 MmcQ/YjbR family DNA-binding protein [Sphingomonas tagetis]
MSNKIIDDVRAWGLTLPGAHLKSPWPEHSDLAVNDKTFAYLSTGDAFRMSVKLRFTSEVALDLPFATPTAYGLGKSGWVTFEPEDRSIPDLKQLREWVEESYRAQAPKKLVKELDARD